MPILRAKISTLKQKRDVAGLLKILRRDDVRARRDVIHALGGLRDPVAIPALTAILAQSNSRISEQIEAVKALGKFADDRAVDALLEANAASIAREHADIEQATVSPQEKPFRPGYYINRISADEYTLRSEIATALGNIGGERALDALFQMLAMESGWMESTVRGSISQVIARTLERNDGSYARILVERVRHASPDVRWLAAHSLRQFHGGEIAHALLDVAKSEKEEFAIREAALGSLAKIADEKILPDLDELARGANRAIARLAAHAALEIRHRHQPHEQA